MEDRARERIVTLDPQIPVWDFFYTVAPLVLVGTREGERFDFAPKHMVTPLGWHNYFGFVCTPHHRTYHNAKHAGAFTVTFVRPTQLNLAALGAVSRADATGSKPVLDALPLIPAEVVDGAFLRDGYVFLECELDRIVDGFGENSLIAGRIVAAHVHEDALRKPSGDDRQLLAENPLLAYLAPGRCAEVADSRSFPFPPGFAP